MKEKIVKEGKTPDYNYRNMTSGFRSDSKNSVKHTFDIAWSAIFKILATLVILFFASKIIQVFIVFFFAFLLTASLTPVVHFLRSKGLPKGVSIFSTYIVIGLVLLTLILVMAQPVISDFTSLIDQLPDAMDDVVERLEDYIGLLPGDLVTIDQVRDFLTKDLVGQLLSGGSAGINATWITISGVGSILSSFFISLVLSIYFMFDHDHYLDFLLGQVKNTQKQVLVKELVEDVEAKLGRWMFTQATVMFILGGLTFILLTIFRVEYALPLAVLTGLFSMIPTLGPVIATLIVITFTFIFSGFDIAIFVTIGLLAINQIDNIFVTPRLMSNVVGLSPVVLLLGVMIGFSVGGVIGAIFTVPVLVLIKLGLDFYQKFPKD